MSQGWAVASNAYAAVTSGTLDIASEAYQERLREVADAREEAYRVAMGAYENARMAVYEAQLRAEQERHRIASLRAIRKWELRREQEEEARRAEEIRDPVEQIQDALDWVGLAFDPADWLNAGISLLDRRPGDFATRLALSVGPLAAAKIIKRAKSGSKFVGEAADIVELANDIQKQGISRKDAEALMDMAREAGVGNVLNHIDEGHWIGGPHVQIGPIKHVKVNLNKP